MTEAQRIMLRRADETGVVAATQLNERLTMKTLVREGYAKHVHGMVFKLTEKGKRARGQL